MGQDLLHGSDERGYLRNTGRRWADVILMRRGRISDESLAWWGEGRDAWGVLDVVAKPGTGTWRSGRAWDAHRRM